MEVIMKKYTDFLVTFKFKDGSRKDFLRSYEVPMDRDDVYEQVCISTCLDDVGAVDIEVKGLEI